MRLFKSLALVAIILSSITLIAWLAVKETESNPNVGVQSLETPDWVKKAVFYQIFPERFRDGNNSNNAKTGDVLWKKWYTTAYSRSWGQTPSGSSWFGGDLQGVAEKASYLADLGITAIWFNPTMDSTDNHGYTVIDYKSVNRYFGINHRVGTKVIPDYNASIEVFRNMTAALDEYGINVVLDGVFNHCSAKNQWFDIDNDFATDGAYESNTSQWYDWFTFSDWPDSYDCWWGVKQMPEPKEVADYKKYIYNSSDSVINFWNDLGVDGWRLDCGGDVSHDFWKEFRTYYKGLNPEGFILGEYWDRASDWLKGDEWDSTMNYPFRGAVLAWAKGGSVSTFDSGLRNIKSWYSDEAFYTLFNILDSHDVTRALRELGENKTKMKLAVIFQMTYPGVPVIYYGDEVGMTGGGDPDCRRCYPWPDKGGNPDMDMLNHYKRLIAIRKGYPVLSVGSLKTKLVDNAKKVYVLARNYNNSSRAILVYNNGNLTQTVNVTVSDLGLADGSTLTDVLNNEVYTVSGGKVTVQTKGMWASILISPSVFPCDSEGSPKDVFHEDDYVYCQGSGFPNNTNVRIYVTQNKTWANGDSITDVRTGYNETTTDSNGTFLIRLGLAGNLSHNELPAYYDVVVDVNCDGTFDAGLDTVYDITYLPGITVPETLPIGRGVAILFTIYLIAIIITKRKPPRPRT